MKRVGGLFDWITSRQVLVEAFFRASRGRRGTKMVREYSNHLDDRLNSLSERLRHGRYTFGPYLEFKVRDGKSRLIHAPPFEQRIVHHAITLVCGPVFEKGAVPFSFACRKGLGHGPALALAEMHVGATEWFYHLDVESYYDSMPHELLLVMLARRFREQRLLALFEKLVSSYQTRPGRGLPMGALTSQWLGNFYLDPVDHWALDTFGIGRYVRYMDDMGAWGDQAQLREFREGMLEQLDLRGLKAKRGGILNRCELGMTFLGFTLRPGKCRLHKRGRKRLGSKLSRLHREYLHGQIGEQELQNRGTALFAWASRGDDVEWRRRLLKGHFDFGDALEIAPRDAGWQLHESGPELPFGLSQQEVASP